MATINGKIKTDVIVMDDTYNVSVEIPTNKPVVSKNAYTLTIYNEADREATLTTDDVTMLAHIAASFDSAESTAKFPDNFFLQLSPPASVLPNIKKEDGTTTFAIKSISIQFATGKYIEGSEGAVDVPGSVKGTKEAPKEE